MSQKQYYVKMTFEFGTDMDGELTPKTPGSITWLSMPYADAVLLQSEVVIPCLTDLFEKAGELGKAKAEMMMPPKLPK